MNDLSKFNQIVPVFKDFNSIGNKIQNGFFRMNKMLEFEKNIICRADRISDNADYVIITAIDNSQRLIDVCKRLERNAVLSCLIVFLNSHEQNFSFSVIRIIENDIADISLCSNKEQTLNITDVAIFIYSLNTKGIWSIAFQSIDLKASASFLIRKIHQSPVVSAWEKPYFLNTGIYIRNSDEDILFFL